LNAQLQRTIFRVVALLAALLVTVAILVLVPNMDARLYVVVLGVATAAAMGLEKWITDGDSEIAAPTVQAVNLALEYHAQSVSPPKVHVHEPVTIETGPGPNVPGPAA
jgi:uncharacterized membrane protein YqgA involved in biofilm formation